MQRLGMVEQAIPHPGCSAYLDAVGVHLAEGVLQIVEQDSCGCIVWGLHPLMMPWKAHSNSTSVRHSPARWTGTDVREYPREQAAELPATPRVHQPTGAFHGVPKGFRRPDQVLCRVGIHAKSGTDGRNYLTAGIRRQLVQGIVVHGRNGMTAEARQNGTSRAGGSPVPLVWRGLTERAVQGHRRGGSGCDLDSLAVALGQYVGAGLHGDREVSLSVGEDGANVPGGFSYRDEDSGQRDRPCIRRAHGAAAARQPAGDGSERGVRRGTRRTRDRSRTG